MEDNTVEGQNLFFPALPQCTRKIWLFSASSTETSCPWQLPLPSFSPADASWKDGGDQKDGKDSALESLGTGTPQDKLFALCLPTPYLIVHEEAMAMPSSQLL